MPDSVYAHAARTKKVAALVAVLHKAGVSASMAEMSDARGWLMAAEAAEVPAPSAETIRLVIAQLEELAAEQKAEGEWLDREQLETASERTPARE